MKTCTSPPVRWAIAVALLILFGSGLCRAQVDMYIKFLDGTGVWAGESTAPGRTGWSDLKSVSFGATIPVTFSGGGGTTVGRTTFQDITISKLVDRLTPQIFSTLAAGTSLNAGGSNGDVTIEFVRTGSAGPVVFFRVELRGGIFTSQTSSSADGDAALKEAITMKNNAFRYTYWPILANGSQGTPIIKSWNQVTNTATF